LQLFYVIGITTNLQGWCFPIAKGICVVDMRTRKVKNKRLNRTASGGAVLVTVLWFITILAIFGMGLGRVSWSVYRFARWRMTNLVGKYAVNAIVLMSKFDRMEDLTPDFDSLGELAIEEIYESGTVKIVYSLIDEERKININKSGSAILKNLPSMDMDKAVAVVNSGLRPFSLKEEIAAVKEIDEEDYDAFKDLVTIFGNGALNVNTASEENLELIGMDSGLREQIMEYRLGEDGELYTEDDGYFESTGAIVENLNEIGSVSLSEEQDLNALVSKNLLCVSASSYEIKADVYVNDKIADSYSVIIGKDAAGKKYTILEWRK